MAAHGQQDQLRLGFLTAAEIPQRGYIAGLLVTNRFGRPLEFQCTTPVKPNRTQEILYGPTLVSFILGELISKTLVEKVGIKPHLILTDRTEILELRNHVSLPVACLVEKTKAECEARSAEREAGSAGGEADTSEFRVPSSEFRVPTCLVSIGRHAFQIHPEHASDRETLETMSASVASDADLSEPINRVLEALKETMGAAA